MITAVLLLAQFWILRSRSLVRLGCGFTAAMVAVHVLTFPGLFSPTDLLGTGQRSTAWLYMFWHAGFSIIVIAYAFSRHDDVRKLIPRAFLRQVLVVGGLFVLFIVFGLTLLATAGQSALPAIMHGNSYTVVVPATWLVSILALLALWARTLHTMLDTWLMVVMCAWIFDIGLSVVFNAGRFDLGFYSGRIYGL